MKYEKDQKYVAKTAFGLEEVLNNELKKLGIGKTEIFKRAVEFRASLDQLYKANLALRTAFRILNPFFHLRLKLPINYIGILRTTIGLN